MREGVFASPGVMSKASLDKASPPTFSFSQASGTCRPNTRQQPELTLCRDPVLVWDPEDLLPALGELPSVGMGEE